MSKYSKFYFKHRHARDVLFNHLCSASYMIFDKETQKADEAKANKMVDDLLETFEKLGPAIEVPQTYEVNEKLNTIKESDKEGFVMGINYIIEYLNLQLAHFNEKMDLVFQERIENEKS